MRYVGLDNPPGLFEPRCGQERAGKEWPLFFRSFGEKKVDGGGPDVCQYLWNGELNEMVLGFWCICVWVVVSKVSQYPRESKIIVPGQTPGLVVPFGPLVLTDRQNRRHSIWIY